MKQKLLTLFALLLGVCSGAWADEAIISWNMGTNGEAATGANSITGASGCAAVGFTIAITGNNSKTWSNGNGDITYSSTTYKTLKNSNGAQNTITCPSGKVATQVVFYATSNGDSAGKLSEIDGTSCNDEVSSLKNYTTPTVITKSIDNKASFTFTFSTKQVCFIAVVTYTDASDDVVANPAIALDGTNLTMSCVTEGATVHYTLDGSEPTASSPAYSSAITLENSCTVRAKAFKGASNEYSSNIVKRDCFVSHALATNYITLLGYTGGIVSGDVWTGTNFTITNNVEGRGIGYTNLAGATDGFKLNHTDTYTIQPSEGVKVTKLMVVGKSWLKADGGNNASTISFDGFTPATGSFFDYPTDGETYIKTIEFTPTTEQTYGQAITMRPGTNQLGAYIEVYGDIITYNVTYNPGANGTGIIEAGEKEYGIPFKLATAGFTREGYNLAGWATYDGGPQVYALDDSYSTNADITLYPVWSKTVTEEICLWDFTNWSDDTKTDILSCTEKWNQYEKADNGGLNFDNNGRSNATALSNNTLTTDINIIETNGLQFTAPAFGLGLIFNLPSTDIGTYHGSQYLWLYGNSSTIKIPNVPANSIIEIGVESHKSIDARGVELTNIEKLEIIDGEKESTDYQVCKWHNPEEGDVTITPSKGLHIYYIAVTCDIEAIPVSTLEGRNYATFIATKNLDFASAEGITAYIATGLNGGNDAVVLQSVDVVPAGTPIIVKTTTQGATVNVPVTTAEASDVSANKLVAGDGTTVANSDYYYLASDQFHLATSGTLQSGKAYLQIPATARDLSIVIDDATALTLVNSEKGIVNREVYNLAGQRVAQPKKGLYIKNGKKVIIK